MTIKAALIDISNTILDSFNSVIKDTPTMIGELRKRKIEVFFVTNNFYSTAFPLWSKRDFFNIEDESYILHKEKVGGLKGSKKFVQYVCSKLNIKPNEILYLGDEKFDCYEAVNSGVVFFRASWIQQATPYGIPVDKPLTLIRLLDVFFRKDHLWYFTINEKDPLNRQIVLRALLDPDTATISGIKNLIKSKGKQGPDQIKGYPSDWYLSMHLFASIYLEGLHLAAGRSAIWCLYPGHDGPHQSILSNFVSMASQAFNEKNFSNLIIRHEQAKHSSASRYQHILVNLNNQLSTINLNSEYKTVIKDKTVVVVDDFTTEAYSFETARNFIFNAGAASVICIAVGKYGKTYLCRFPKPPTIWDSFVVPSSITQNDFSSSWTQPTIDRDALKFF